jgi:transposase
MTVPGIGPVTALTYVSTIDDPTRFRPLRRCGPLSRSNPPTLFAANADIHPSIAHDANSSSKALTSFRSSVSKPSVNEP